jgi:hypothetical protein
LNPQEIQFLYKSNLSKTDTWEWIFQTLNTCLAQTWDYDYRAIVTSRYGYSDGIWRWISTCIPWVSFTWWVDVNLWTWDAKLESMIFSWQYSAVIKVEDWIWRNGWTGSVRISSNFSWQEKNFTFSATWFKMKNNSIQDFGHYMIWIIPEDNVGLVQLSPVLSEFSNIVMYQWNNQGTPYFVSNYPELDFMCNGWIYGDQPFIQLEVPGWVPVDKYSANIYWTIEPIN